MSVSTIENDRKKGRKPGTPKTGGRKAGTPNKSTMLASTKFQKACEDNDFDFGKELVNSLKFRDLDYARVLISIMDYYFGKVSPHKPEEPEQDDLTKEVNLGEVFK